MRATLKWVGTLAVALFLLGELGARWLGLTDFPVYEANSQIGYIPAANQKGSFLNVNDWEFNSLHMGAREFEPSAERRDVLLVGDSIVLGGNPVKQSDKLGPQLEKALTEGGERASVWPISAGSWALLNELEWIRENPSVLQAVDEVIFVLNSADFGQASSWACNSTHPLAQPGSALWYLFNKYVYAVESCEATPQELLVPPRDLSRDFAEYMGLYGGKTRFVLYPTREELASKSLRDERFLQGLRLLEQADAKFAWLESLDWQPDASIYRDGIHPTAYGTTLLARFIADALVSESVVKQDGN